MRKQSNLSVTGFVISRKAIPELTHPWLKTTNGGDFRQTAITQIFHSGRSLYGDRWPQLPTLPTHRERSEIESQASSCVTRHWTSVFYTTLMPLITCSDFSGSRCTLFVYGFVQERPLFYSYSTRELYLKLDKSFRSVLNVFNLSLIEVS